MSPNPIALAKVTWENPETGTQQEYVLVEGVSVSIGRSPENEIYIPEKTVSRHHASITYKAGVFVITDAGSANGVFVNDIKVEEPYPLIHGDVIRLYLPTLKFMAVVPEGLGDPVKDRVDEEAKGPRPRILITSGSLAGTEVAMTKDVMTFGRAIANAPWEIPLPDHAVSRPHARIYVQDGVWYLEDLGSSNGTMVEGEYITKPIMLQDGTTITVGETILVFHNSL
jgi:pSer/pThr/pTyr-binding forkhead associated (FHA) protein